MNHIGYTSRALAKLGVLLVMAFALSACLFDTTPRVLQIEEDPVVTEEGVVDGETDAVAPEAISVDELEVEEGAVTEADLEAVDEAEAVIVEDAVVDDEVIEGEAIEVVDLSTVLVRATFLLNREVENAEGQDIGAIDDFVVDTETGRILYVILDYGGVLDIGDEELPVPLSAFAWNPELEMALAVDETVLEALPSVDDEWPLEIDNVAWDDEIFAYWSGLGVDVPDVTDSFPIRLGSLFNLQVGELGAIIGPVEDMMIDLGQGEVRYLAIFADPSFYSPDRIVFVPFAQLEVEVIDAEPVPVVIVDQAAFMAALNMDRSLFLTVDFLDEAFSQRLDESWNELGVPTE